jgi:hypothetical protein
MSVSDFNKARQDNAAAGGVQPWSVGELFPYSVMGHGNTLRGFNGIDGWMGPRRPYLVIEGRIDRVSFNDAYEQAELDIALRVSGPLVVVANLIGLKAA